MEGLLAYCGLDCARCPAYIATQADDLPAKERVIAQWRAEFNAPDMDISAATCDGCSSAGRHGGYCDQCPVRACAVQREVANCALCPEYSCTTLDELLAMVPDARATLEEIRRLA